MSNYGKIKDFNGKTTSQYNTADNIERKSNRTGEQYDHVGQNKASHVYTTSGSSIQQTREKNEAERQKNANKAAPVKVFTDEEKKKYQEQLANRPAKPTLKRSEDLCKEEMKYAEVPSTCPGCKKGTPKLKGHTNDVEPLTWWHCPSCETTGIKRLPENETEIEKGEGFVDDTVLTKTHPRAFEIFNALSEAKKIKKAFDLVKAKMCKADEEEPHADDPKHEQKEKKAASKIKRTAQQILDMHKDKKK
jgi:hypothetical protein